MTEAEDETASLDPVALAILEVVRARGPEKSCCPTDVARLLADRRRRAGDPPDLWRRYLQAVREQARFLARQGRIDILRRGERQDPTAPIKGVIRLRIASGGN
ncbi:MAG: DUF3253 domain-containing protein [Pseudomonadota bacterium]